MSQGDEPSGDADDRPRLTISEDDLPAPDAVPAALAPPPRRRLTVTDVEPAPLRVEVPAITIDLAELRVSDAPRRLRRRRIDVGDPSVLLIGSQATSDVVIDHPSISPLHAELRLTAHGPMIVDVSRSSARIVVDGQFVRQAYLREGARVTIGPARFVLRGRQLLPAALPQGAPLMRALGVSVRAGRRTILEPTWLEVRPGELVALIGESGAGKSTLLKAITGVHEAASGVVYVGDEPLAARRTELGYVPQDEIVHPSLTVREALGYAARLRLPSDATRAQRAAAVSQVIDEVGLAQHEHTRIGSLSGGQRKRVGVATELVSRPNLLFLDEPTTGLDPGLEDRMMHLFRTLADGGRGVVLVTHAVQNLDLCDRLVVMARGGQVAFAGTPSDARAFFGVRRTEEIYTALDEAPHGAWHARFIAERRPTGWGALPAAPPAGLRAPARAGAGQVGTLTARGLRLLSRDHRTLLTIAIQVPVFALAIAALFGGDVFGLPPGGRPGGKDEAHVSESAQLLFLLVTIAFWFGAIGSAREIVKERGVAQRELDVGVRPTAYLTSKLLVLTGVVGVQAIALAAIVLWLRPLHEAQIVYAQVVLLMLLAAGSAVALGLLVSASARSEDQATTFIPVLLVPQLLFGGAVVTLERMEPVMRGIAMAAPVQWAFAGAGTAIDMNGRGEQDRIFTQAGAYGPDFFDVPPIVAALILAAMTGLVLWVVRRRLGEAR